MRLLPFPKSGNKSVERWVAIGGSVTGPPSAATNSCGFWFLDILVGERHASCARSGDVVAGSRSLPTRG